jgi:tetraacyldisaccharide 4'-kinase
MVIIQLLLFPFAAVYDAITRVRNHLYSIGHKKSFRFQTMVISVGNLSAGGSGKTPMIEYLIRLLNPPNNLATLSRGYGRKTRGIRFAVENDRAATIGDEPVQLFRKFGSRIRVTVGEERAQAIPTILLQFPETDAILMDDAFQHRTVDPQLSILLTEYARPFYKDFVLPMGRLRESRKGASRADIIVVTKCPVTLSEDEMERIRGSAQPYANGKPVFFAGLDYDQPVPFRLGDTFSPKVILVSGIAHAELFEEYAASKFTVIQHFKFADHYSYSAKDLKMVAEFCRRQSEKPVILTTEKDMVKIIDLLSSDPIPEIFWFYLPVRTAFLKNGPDFDKLVLQSLENAKLCL